MTLEEQKAAELAQAEAKAKAEAEEKAKAERENETDEERGAREAEEKESRSKIDYEAELKREQERRIAAEKAAADAAFKLRERKRKENGEYDEDEEIEDEDKPLTAKQLQGVLQRDREQSRKEFQRDMIAEKARKLAGSDSEANLIIEIHRNRSFPSDLSLDEQLEEAYAIANRKILMAQNEELKRSLRSKETVSTNAAGSYRESTPLNEPKMSSADVQAIKAAGFIWDGSKRLYIKQLAGGKKILTYDPKTKSRKVIEK